MGPVLEIQDELHFRVNGWLVDLTRIEHWSRSQGGAKFHGIRTALSILRHFTARGLRDEANLSDPEQRERVMVALHRLAEYGYYIPPEVLAASK
jgi:hypothetical protein